MAWLFFYNHAILTPQPPTALPVPGDRPEPAAGGGRLHGRAGQARAVRRLRRGGRGQADPVRPGRPHLLLHARQERPLDRVPGAGGSAAAQRGRGRGRAGQKKRKK